MRFPFSLLAVFVLFSSASCSGGEPEAADESVEWVGGVDVALTSQIPDAEEGRVIRWSPYGKQLALTEDGGGMNAELPLGPEGAPPIRLRLEKGEGSPHFDRLSVDINRDGEFDTTELHETEVSETRDKFWSSFDAVVGIPGMDPKTENEVVTPYALSLWYVEDPRMPDEEPVIRFSRRGWMEGDVVLDGIDAVLMVTESAMDGLFSTEDSWALASRDSAADILKAGYSRSLGEHAWLFEKPYRVMEIDPSGRHLVVAPFDPGITRAEEEEMNDHLAVDRNAARSGQSVVFLHDFEEAKAMAQSEGKPLLVDFETTWCGPCKVMDEWVYTADDVVEAAKSVVSVKVDGDERLDLKERFGVTGFPTMILLGVDGTEVRRASGYVNVADMTEFLETLN